MRLGCCVWDLTRFHGRSEQDEATLKLLATGAEYLNSLLVLEEAAGGACCDL